ncbi:MAG: sulfotransferase [Magnetococcales bacterium]|nr:sulfotransferase [Magnetococcales bacterium]
MSAFKLIMISAMYENGGNTMHRLLDGHPRFYVYPFESQVGTGAGNDFLTSYVPIRYRWPEFSGGVTPDQAYEMFWDEEMKTLLRVPSRSKFRDCGMKLDETARRAAFRKVCEGKPATRATFVEAYYRSTFEAWENFNRTGQEDTWVGYNPVQCLDTDKIFQDFPDAQVIHVVRNPFSGFSDTIKRPFPLGPVRYAWTWNLCQHMALTYKEKYAGRFHIIRFEDFAADPNQAVGGLLEAMGYGMSEKCAYPSFNGERLREVYPWGTIRTPTPAANLATANELSAEQKKILRTECAVMLPLLGYSDLTREIGA